MIQDIAPSTVREQVSAGGVAAARRPRRLLPPGRALRLGRPRLHAHLGARARARAPLPDQPLRHDVRRDHRVEPGEDRPRGQQGDGVALTRSTRPASRSTARSTRRARTRSACCTCTRSTASRCRRRRTGLLPISQQSIFVLASLAYHDYEGVALQRRREAAPGTRPRRQELPDAAQPRPADRRRDDRRRVPVHVPVRGRLQIQIRAQAGGAS